jgi:hypothetical protein
MRKNRKILSRTFRRSSSYIIAGVVLLFIIAGTGYLWGLHKQRDSGLIINHKYKTEVLGLDCIFCHGINEQNTRFMVFPDHENCGLCHSEAVDEESGKKNCELCHYLPDNKTAVRKNIELAPHVSFDHKIHEEKGIDCLSCHSVFDEQRVVANEMLPPMATCTECHSERRVMDIEDCSRCHVKDYEKIEPLNHTMEWKNTHGEGLARDVMDSDCRTCHTPELKNSCTKCHHQKQIAVGKEDYCATCHGEDFENTRPLNHTPFFNSNHGRQLTQAVVDTTCTMCHNPQNNNDCLDCHRKENPKSHKTAWRIKSHGNRSQLNRESCAVCHDQSECITCHTTNEPFSHTGLWDSPANRHCINCHMEGSNFASGPVGSNCTFCHQGGEVWAEHTSLQKPGHFVATDCTTCHGVASITGPRIRHPFNPDTASCKSCHQ